MSLPLVFLVYSLAGLITSVVVYSLKSSPMTPPGYPVYSDHFTKWTVVGTLGGLAGVLIISALVNRR
jgi:drug/metabolite transporter (DMT)-like permease